MLTTCDEISDALGVATNRIAKVLDQTSESGEEYAIRCVLFCLLSDYPGTPDQLCEVVTSGLWLALLHHPARRGSSDGKTDLEIMDAQIIAAVRRNSDAIRAVQAKVEQRH